MTRHYHWLIITVLILAAAVSCSDHQTSGNSDGFTDADGYNHADSLVSDIGDTRDFQRTLTVIDSLEQNGELSLVKTIFYRTITYNMMGQQSNSLRLYYQLASIDVSQLTTQADLESYIYSYNNYVRLLCDMRRYDRALREAYTADRKLKAAGYDSFAEHHDIAQIIGECQLYMGQADEAATTFQKSLQAVHTRLATYKDPLDYRECQKTMNAIAKAYIRCGRYEEAVPWISLQDSLYAVADAHPQRDTVYIDEMKAEINYSKALLAHAQGRNADAEKAFKEYLSTQTAKQVGSIIDSNEYLMLTEHYAEAAHNYELLNRFLREGGYKATLENFGRYMLPKFRANYLAGNNDTALYIANMVAEYYDSALIRQKIIDADLLTTVYDTEGKERQIAEQNARLSKQRLIMLAVVTFIIIVFFHIYMIQRRRAFKKLNAANRELILANERAEESARMKTKFIQQISHEVRTPLNVLSGFTQVLAAPDIEISSEELQSISHKIVENSERITHLVDKMLDLSQINKNTYLDCNDSVGPADIAAQAVKDSGILQASHLEFDMHISPEAKALTFTTNKKAASKALTLLLDNAIKFTHPLAFKGKQAVDSRQNVTLSVSIAEQQIVFTVEDTGIGIPPEQAENIFKEFVQLDEYSDGTGIGLSIARSLAQQLHGDVVLDTTYTSGARFVMTIRNS